MNLARNDLRALLKLLAPAGKTDTAGAGTPSRATCGPWRRVERWIGRLLLPKRADAQSPPVIPQLPAAQLPPAVLQARDSVRAVNLLLPQLSSITDLTSARDEQYDAIRTVRQYSVEIHKKFALSVACMNFVLIGIALALRFPRGGIGLVIGGSLVIFALFYVGLTAGENLADVGTVSPALAMWLPNGIVFVVGVLGLIRVNREFGSTRGGDLADLKDLLLLGRLRRWLRKG